MKLISIKRINEHFSDLTFISSVRKGWFKFELVEKTERIFRDGYQINNWWKFASTGTQICPWEGGDVIGKGYESVKDGEIFYFTPKT